MSTLNGTRTEITLDDVRYPAWLRSLPGSPDCLYVMGDVDLLYRKAVCITGARKATPYGLACARQFAALVADLDLVLMNGGALGCETDAIVAALDAGGKVMVALAGGLDDPYPTMNVDLFQRVLDAGGCVMSASPWDAHATPHQFRARRHLIADVAHLHLVCECGVPSGTFDYADHACSIGCDVYAVPGNITSDASRGTNELIRDGVAKAVTSESDFQDVLVRYSMTLMGTWPETSFDI